MSEFDRKSLDQLANCRMGETILSKDLDGTGYPIFSADSSAGEWGRKKDISKVLQRGSIVIGARGTIGNPRLPDHDEFGCTQTTIAVTPYSEVNPYYLKLALESSDLKRIAAQQAVPMLTIGELCQLEVPIPPLPEQKKIAEILSGIDKLITHRARRHEALCQLIGSLITEVDQYGVATDSGAFIYNKEKIPGDWKLIPYKDLLRPAMKRFTLSDDKRYSPVIVRRRHAGIETRETKSGAKILVKDQFFANENCFLISKRQVIHGSTGIVPKNLGENPIISKEYLQLVPINDEVLDIGFMDFYSRSSLFHESIRMSAYGVDIEKYVFKDDTWYSKKMLVPPLAVQKLISDSFSSIQEVLGKNSSELSKLRDLKIAVAADLLSGRKRVSV